MYIYLILALQGFCIYHSIKTKNETYWVFVIFFVPIIGSIIYIVTQVLSKRDIEMVQDGLTSIINPTKKVLDLKKQLEFSETFQNKVNLADAYFEIYDYNNAINYYENAIDSNFSEDTYVISKLIDAHYYAKNYKKAINHFNSLDILTQTISSNNLLHYGLSLNETGKPKTALKQLKKLNVNFSNYNERLVLAEFLIEKGETSEAKIILTEILEESKYFTKINVKVYRQTINVVKSLLKNL